MQGPCSVGINSYLHLHGPEGATALTWDLVTDILALLGWYGMLGMAR